MSELLASRIMPRTTIDIDTTVLRRAKRLARTLGKSLGQVVSELLARALAEQDRETRSAPFRWDAKAMEARIDLEDRDAVYEALDRG